MQNLVYSLNATIPIFAVMVLGWILHDRKLLTDEFVEVANKYVFKVALPVMVFQDLVDADIKRQFDWKFVAFCFVSTLLCFLIIWVIAEIFLKDKTMIGSFVQGSFRSSAAVLGLAFVKNIYSSVGIAPLILVGAVPLYNVCSVIVLTLRGKEEIKDTSGIKKAFINIIKNPILIGVFAGCIVSAFGIHSFPAVISKTLTLVSNTSTPIALLAIGAGFEFKSAMEKKGPTIAATFIKLVGQGLVFIPVAIFMGFRDAALLAVVITLNGPATVSGYIMAKNMNSDSVLASSIIVLSTLLSAGTLTLWIFVLKSMGYLA